MYNIILDKRVIKFIQTLPLKHQKQLKNYILGFQAEPKPHDSQTLKDYEPYRPGVNKMNFPTTKNFFPN
jgi:mRNA-degrading endonuclease RelE of RelBE toxin-antitoxin system